MKRKILAILSIIVAVSAIVAAASFVNAGFGNAGAVYTMDNASAGNHVLYYSRAADGSLTYVSSFSTMGTGTGSALASQGSIALTNNGRFLLVVNAGSNSISVFSVASNGWLTYLSKTGSEGSMPISLTVYDNWVYTLNAGGTGNIAGFWLSNSGTLSYIAGSSQPLSATSGTGAEQIGFNPDGNVLVVTETGTNIIDTYLVNSMGIASPPNSQPSVGYAPYGFAFTGYDTLVVSEAHGSIGTGGPSGTAGLGMYDGTLSSYVLSDQGNLRTVSGSMPTFGAAPCWVAIDGSGSYVYTSNAHEGTISTFSITGTVTLTLTSSIEAKLNIPTLDLAFSKNSQYLYALNGGSVTGFKVYNDGSLWQVTSVSSIPASATGLAAT